MRQSVTLAVILCAALAALVAGCGKKPSHVDPPPGVGADVFPRVYPDPNTDPQP